jgi:VanZ family protein
LNFELKKLLFLYPALILLLAVLPINGPDARLNHVYILHIRLDYLAHFAIFVPWMVMIWYFRGVRFNDTPWQALAWIAAGTAIAVLSELIQYFLPYRSFNINDMAANLIGVALGSVVFVFRLPGKRS